MDRRTLLLGGLGATALLGRSRAVFAGARDKILVRLFLRGGIDGLNVVVPYTDRAYYAARPTIALPRPGQAGGVLKLDGRFGLHPALAPLLPLYRERTLAFVQAVGSPAGTRSHFDAQDNMEAGTLTGHRRSGWLGRLRSKLGGSDLAAVSMQDDVPLALRGGDAIALGKLSSFGLKGNAKTRARLEEGFGALYAGDDTMVAPAGRRALAAIERVRGLSPDKYTPDHRADYGRGPAASQLKDLALLIKSKVGLRVATVDVGGWDTHTAETARLARELKSLSAALAAFHRDLGPLMADVLVLVVSEFGRTVRENGSGGTDHGHGTMMMALGGQVAGGKVYGRWPGLTETQRYQGRDLEVTTDFRTVFGEALEKQIGVRDVSESLGGDVVREPFLGFLRSS